MLRPDRNSRDDHIRSFHALWNPVLCSDEKFLCIDSLLCNVIASSLNTEVVRQCWDDLFYRVKWNEQ